MLLKGFNLQVSRSKEFGHGFYNASWTHFCQIPKWHPNKCDMDIQCLISYLTGAVVRAWAAKVAWAQAHTEIRQPGPGPHSERGPYLRKLLINDKKQKMGHFLGPEFNSTLQTLYLF